MFKTSLKHKKINSHISSIGFLFARNISLRNFPSGIFAMASIITKSKPFRCMFCGLPIPNHRAPIFSDARYKSICFPKQMKRLSLKNLFIVIHMCSYIMFSKSSLLLMAAKIFQWNSRTVEIALIQIAAHTLQQLFLLFRFYKFCKNLQMEIFCHLNQSLYDTTTSLIGQNIFD